jgi:hypothetical protein
VKRPLGTALVLSVAGLVAACGGPASPAAVAPPPDQSIQLAAAHIAAGSFRMSATATMAIDAGSVTGPFASQIASAAQQSGSQSIQEAVQDARDITATVTSSKHAFHLVDYAGTVYVSADGLSYKSAPFMTTLLDQLSASQVRDYAAHLKGTRDQGPSTQGGVATEQYSSSLDPTYLTSLVNKLLPSLFGSIGTAIPPALVTTVLGAMHFQGINLTWYVDKATGHLVREVTHGTIAIDIGSLVAGIAGATHHTPSSTVSGTMLLHESLDAHFSGWGDRIVVSKPNVSGSVTPQQFLQLLVHAPAA